MSGGGGLTWGVNPINHGGNQHLIDFSIVPNLGSEKGRINSGGIINPSYTLYDIYIYTHYFYYIYIYIVFILCMYVCIYIYNYKVCIWVNGVVHAIYVKKILGSKTSDLFF